MEPLNQLQNKCYAPSQYNYYCCNHQLAGLASLQCGMLEEGNSLDLSDEAHWSQDYTVRSIPVPMYLSARENPNPGAEVVCKTYHDYC